MEACQTSKGRRAKVPGKASTCLGWLQGGCSSQGTAPQHHRSQLVCGWADLLAAWLKTRAGLLWEGSVSPGLVWEVAQVSQAFLLKVSHITQIIAQPCAREGRERMTGGGLGRYTPSSVMVREPQKVRNTHQGQMLTKRHLQIATNKTLC